MENVLSVRLVVADFYLDKPIYGLDTCYSEFRGSAIKKVPIIRIFGADAQGRKVCMHVHGVYPYFYIPYENKADEPFGKIAYQIATNVDKAINVSLGQSNSTAQHVYKIQLVKGIPFYGYHRKEHQFLKLYMYNPRFVRRAANLLQNGAIMNKTLAPHESHVPYILQFMIDYNLYGMSPVHVPVHAIKVRQTNEAAAFAITETAATSQMLAVSMALKQTVSRLEVDIDAALILNRLQLLQKHSSNTNPGIDYLWCDEKVRRQKLLHSYGEDQQKIETIPALEIPATQARENVLPAESEVFYKSALQHKLDSMEQSMCLNESLSDQALSALTNNSSALATTSKEQRRTFNLRKLLENSVYPEECAADNKHIVNASFVESHLTKSNSQMELLETAALEEANESNYLDDTIVDEELILNLTQTNVPLNATLTERDLDVLDILQQLEEENENTNHIDLDSSLAPLSQPNKDSAVSSQSLDKETLAAATNRLQTDNELETEMQKETEMDVENDIDIDMHDFSIVLEDLDEFIHKFTQSQEKKSKQISLPQLDGADDNMASPSKQKCSVFKSLQSETSPKTQRLLGTPKKRISTASKSPMHSPRTPASRAALKYAPLPLILSNRSNKKSNNQDENVIKRVIVSLEQKLKIDKKEEMHSKAKDNLQQIQTKRERKTQNAKRSKKDLDKTHITCNLRPAKSKEKQLETYKTTSKTAEDLPTTPRSSRGQSRELRSKRRKTIAMVSRRSIEINADDAKKCLEKKLDNEALLPKRKLRSHTSKIVEMPKTDLSEEISESSGTTRENSEEIIKDIKQEAVTPNTISVSVKKESKFSDTVEAATPTLHIHQSLRSRMLHRKVDKRKAENASPSPCSNDMTAMVSTPKLHDAAVEEAETDVKCNSFYEISFGFHSPSVFSDGVHSPEVFKSNTPTVKSSAEEEHATNTTKALQMQNVDSTCNDVIVTTAKLPPTYQQVLADCAKLNIPEHEFQKPFFSNPNDKFKQKEVGFTVLQITGNKINDLPEFESVFGAQIHGLNAWRQKKLTQIGGAAMLNRYRNAQSIRQFLACNRTVQITPALNPPTYEDAQIWLKMRKISKAVNVIDDEKLKLQQLEDDSPIKIQRQNTINSLKSATEANVVQSADLFISSNESSDNVAVDVGNESTLTNKALAKMERLSFVKNLKSFSSEENENNLSFGLNITLNNTYGFKLNLENLQQAKSDIEFNYLTIMSLEVFVPTRADLLPDPMHDSIHCIFYAIENSLPITDSSTADEQNKLTATACGYIMLQDITNEILAESAVNLKYGLDANIQVKIVNTELEALQALVELCLLWDPDIYAGYEIEMSSWGFIIERAKYLNFEIASLLSRVPTQKARDYVDEDRDQFTDLDFEMKLSGRILLDVWRLMRSEIALTSYTFENVVYHIMHKRCPWHSHRSLSDWYLSSCSRWIVMEYYLERVRGTLGLLDQLDLIGRTSEMAKLMGIQFYEVLSRGSQFRVESMMLRIAKPKNLVPLSPSVQQRAHMRAPEYLPLILEPQSRLYVDPVIVLDFQSLYPSMIIAYNYCFSTCLGRVEFLGQSAPFEFGASQLRVSPKMLRKLLDQELVTISPCGVVFVKSSVREGILPRMLKEILDTRQMVKQSMKLYKSNTALQRILHSRQLGLKLMANVTYGYTAANFSGRMPSVEVGDSVVAKGRETLEQAIKMVEANETWNVKVVYGDTDSMFVLVPGRNREQAFKIGEEIAEMVTKSNPQPVKLKLEKVYQPCILQTKKRYVGYMYESANQQEAVYEAKGIETVRRDGCPAVAKMLEKVLRILFESKDVSQVKHYVCRQFTKLLSGRANVQDLIFAKEFRGINGYKPTACVPALEMTRKWMQTDPRHIPRRGERVPFIIINGPPGVPLIRLVRSPHEVLLDEGLKINAVYYITKAIIPPLNRCLLLIGADVNEWFAELPRKLFPNLTLSMANEVITLKGINQTKKSTISQYFSSDSCIIDCGRQTTKGVCEKCMSQPLTAIVSLEYKTNSIEKRYHLAQQICQACCGRNGDINCASLDCPVLYVSELRRRELKQISYFRDILKKF